MAKKLYIKTNGCQMNEYDSSKMADVLRESHDLETKRMLFYLTPALFVKKLKKRFFRN